MSETTRRHPNVVNLAELPLQERLTGSKMGGKFGRVADAAGGAQIGCSVFEVPPGRAAMPRHFHCNNEEAVFVLSGRGTARIGDATVEIKAGDWLSFPIGPAHAHQVTNTGDEPLRYLALSTRLTCEVVGYPDSKKVMAAAAPDANSWFTKPWVRHITEESAAVDYFKGEDVG